ncbi:MAG: ribonuclease III [Legionella sp.]|nr:ribonuclease III [Legionella sp.]
MSSSPVSLEALMKSLGYFFKAENLLQQALTHCSAGPINNERLEFLGDALLSFVIADELFKRFFNASEGELSRLRAFLVKGEALASISTELNLGQYLLLGPGELKTGGNRRQSILADAFEAVIAAVYLDGGIEPCRQLILSLYEKKLAALTVKADMDATLKDAKTRLQEFLQSNQRSLPTYSLLQVEGKAHEQIFYVTCHVASLKKAVTGKGSNRRRAEQHAAEQMLKLLLG